MGTILDFRSLTGHSFTLTQVISPYRSLLALALQTPTATMTRFRRLVTTSDQVPLKLTIYDSSTQLSCQCSVDKMPQRFRFHLTTQAFRLRLTIGSHLHLPFSPVRIEKLKIATDVFTT